MKPLDQPFRAVICFAFFGRLAVGQVQADTDVPHGAGGGPPAKPTSECIPAGERENILRQTGVDQSAATSGRQFKQSPGGPGVRLPSPPLRGPLTNATAPELYPFVPMAGTEWQDRFVNNFVDLDPTSGILDWDCTDFTYDGHQGHDISLRSFGEQDIGVPVFAALDGTVVDAHDGEFDKNTVMAGQPANYVVLFHGGTQYTWYFHLRENSVAVSTGQVVLAGTQLGLAGSSGNSSGPHLHFESRFNGTYYEPSAGPCRAGESDWVNQIPIRRELWLEDFAMHNTNDFPADAFLPYNPVRTGTIVRTGSSQPIGCWYIIHNLPAGSTWQLRYVRPDQTEFFNSGSQAYGNPFYRYSSFWVWYGLDPDVAGAWTLELSVNGQVMVQAPFTVLDTGGVPTNHTPGSVTAALDPASPGSDDVVFCRLTVPLLIDPDYDLVSFRYQWRVNGQLIRDTTNAAFSDALARSAAPPGGLLTCTVTPYDGQVFGPEATAQAVVGGTQIQLTILPAGAGQVSIHWPMSQVSYTLESTSSLAAPSSWTGVTDSPAPSGSEWVVTTSITSEPRFFRLRWP